MSSYEFFTIMSIMAGFSTIILIGLCGTAAWWLNQSRAVGGRWMLWGMLLQVVRLIHYGYERVSYVSGNLHRPDELIFIVWAVSAIGLLMFAIGLFLHAKNQRGLQSRVDELERILADMHSRER